MRKSIAINSKINDQFQKSLSPSTKIIGALDKIVENSRNKGYSVAPILTSLSKGLPSIGLCQSNMKESISQNKTMKNSKFSFKKSCESNLIVNDLFDDEYLKENDAEIQKYLKKNNIRKDSKPFHSPLYSKMN